MTGITLLSCVGKLFTSIINERLCEFVDTNEFLKENQTGFHKGYSTLYHCFLLNAVIELFQYSKKKLFCGFVDYEKAFDNLWRNALWWKLSEIHVVINKNSKVFNVIRRMYDSVKSCIYVNTCNTNSDFFASNVGVSQGENLSPILFSVSERSRRIPSIGWKF